MGGSSDENGRKSIVDGNGNIYIGGSLRGSNVDFDPGSNSFYLNSAGQKDIYVAKYDKNGLFKWAFKIGGSNEDDLVHLTLDRAGDLLITGYFRGQNVDFDPGPGLANLNSNGESGGDPGYGGDIYVAKFDTLGNYKWAFNIGGNLLGESGQGIAVDNNNNILLTGYSHCPADFDPSTANFILDGSSRPIFVAKYTSNGQLIWAFNTGTGGIDNSGISIAADNSDNVIVTGYFQGNNVDFNPSASSANNLSSIGSFEIFLAKYSPAGTYIWAFSLPGNVTDVARDLVVDSNNDIYIVGDFNSSSVDLDPSSGTNIINNNGSNDIFLAKYSSNGQHQWGFKIGAAGQDLGWGMTKDAANNIIILGSFTGTVDFDPSAVNNTLSSSGNSDAFISKYSSSGQYVCAFNIGGNGPDESYSASVLNDHLYISGTFNSANADFDPGAGVSNLTSSSYDIYMTKYDWSFVPPAGNITGGNFCPGQQTAQLIFNATAGTGPYTLTITDGTNNYVYPNIQSGVSFNLSPVPTQTTTYTLLNIKDAVRCSPQVTANSTATLTVACGAEICNNGIDDDGDNLIDCADQDCLGCTTPCGPVPSINPKIFNTGNNGQGGLIAVGSNDRHWTVSNTLNGIQRPAIYTGNCAPGYWTPTPYPDAGWITDQQYGVCGFVIPQNATTPRYFTTKFDVPASLVSSLRLAFDIYADNYIGEVYLNGVPQGISNTTSDLYCAGCNMSFTLNSGFVAGTNTLTILLLQMPIPETPLGQFLGLLVNASSSLDSDNDGVVDGADQCPGTPPGVSVDAAGCFDLFITSNSPVCEGDSLVLEASNAGTGSIYQWTTPAGQILTGKRVVINNITSTSGTGKYVLQVTDVYNCTHKDSVNIQINARPIINLAPAANLCTGSSIQLNASGGGTYQWTPSTGLNNSLIANPIATPAITTTYQVLVISSNGCKDSATTTITVNPTPTAAVSGNVTICQKDSVQLTASGGGSYQWIPATGLSNANIANPMASPATTTNYKVLVTNSSGCKDSAYVTVTVNPLPVINLSPNASICPSDSAQLSASGGVTYQWFPATGLSNSGIANPKASPITTTTYKVIVTTAEGCRDSASTTVSVLTKPVATASNDITICSGDTVLLSASGGTNYQWFPTTGISNPIQANTNAYPNTTTEYSAIVTNADGCKDTAKTIVTVTAKPDLDLGPNREICNGDIVSFDATTQGASSYLWNNGSTDAAITVSQTGSYSVLVGISGCISPVKDTVNLSVLSLPTVNLGPDTSTCNFEPLILKAQGTDISTYLWSTGGTDSFIVINSAGPYQVMVSNACGTASDEAIIAIEICSDDIYFPSAFTPNYDGRNDLFKAAYMNGVSVTDYNLKVFNRWGQLVFKTDDYTKGWDGIFKGKMQQTDVFVWIAEYKKSTSSELIRKKGTVTLLR